MLRPVRRFALLATAVLIAGCSSGGSRLATDAVLRRQFEQHRAAFDSLVAAAVADTELLSVSRGSTLGIYLRDGPQANRLLTEDEVRATGRSEYGRLLASVGLHTLSRQGWEPQVAFVMSADRALTKGLLFTRGGVGPQRASLDDIDGTGPTTTAYVPLAPGWFLFIQPKAD